MTTVLDAHARQVVLNVQDLSVRFGSLNALREVSLTVRVEDTVGVIGPNGAGKSTLLAAIAGQLAPSNGSVMFLERDITAMRPATRASLGLHRTFQALELFDEMTVRDNLMVAASARMPPGGTRYRSGSDARRQVDQMIEDLDLGRYEFMDARSLSAPVRRLVSYGRAMMGVPKCLLLDEPAAGLSDSERAAFAARIIRDVTELGICLVVVEHDMGFVRNICGRVYALDAGTMIASGSFEQVAADPKVREAYLGPLADSRPEGSAD